jgi:hypothetical protein
VSSYYFTFKKKKANKKDREKNREKKDRPPIMNYKTI